MQKKHTLPIVSSLLLSSLTLAALPSCLSDDSQDVEDAGESDSLDKGIPKIEIIRNASGQYRFNVKANNGEIVLRSETYLTLAAATNGVDSVKLNGVDLERYVLLQATNGKWYFNLRAANNKIIGTSQLYSTKANAKRGMKTAAAVLGWVDEPEQVSPALPRFDTYKALDGKHYARLVGPDGDVMLLSDGFATKTAAKQAIEKIYAAGVKESSFNSHDAQNGQRYFAVYDDSGVLAYGQTFSTTPELKASLEATHLLLRQLTPAAKYVCKLTRRADVPVQDMQGGEIITVANPGPASQEAIVLKSEYDNQSNGLDAFLGNYSFAVMQEEGYFVVIFTENEFVFDETAFRECEDVPTSRGGDNVFCEERIFVDANLGVDNAEDNSVYAFDFSCQYR